MGFRPDLGSGNVMNVYASSSLVSPTYACIAQLVEQLFCKQQVVGSYPAIGSIY